MSWSPKIQGNTGENMEHHWGSEAFKIDYKDKIVLDLGAGNGESTEYFLFKGAKKVIAVEGYFEFFKTLFKNVETILGEKVVPIQIMIKDPEDIESLILEYKPDIIKSDIEGAEIHILKMKNEIWNLVQDYIIEFHANYGFVNPKVMYEKCVETGFITVVDSPTFNNVIHITKGERTNV